MKLSDIFEFNAVGFGAPDASRPTPAASIQHHGQTAAPLPHEFCKGRDWCEQKEKKKKKRRKLRDLEQRIDNATPRT